MEDLQNDSVEDNPWDHIEHAKESTSGKNENNVNDAENAEMNNHSDAEDTERINDNPADVEDTEMDKNNPSDTEDAGKNGNNPTDTEAAEKKSNDVTDAEAAEKNNSNPTDMEDTKNSNNPTDAEDAGTNHDNPNAIADALTPRLGMIFGSVEEAFRFYKAYGYKAGFRVRRRTKHDIDGFRYRSTFTCYKGTNFEIRRGVNTRRGPVEKTACPAMMVIKDEHFQSQWEVQTLQLEHNHPLDPPDVVRFMQHFREMPESLKKQLRINEKAIGTVFSQGRGDLTCLFTEPDRNHVSKISKSKLGQAEYKALARFFDNMQAQNSNFFFTWDMDKEGRLRNVFWADARARTAYQYFNDVITFDTTYIADQYRVPLTTFVGVNHHGQSVLFGCGLLVDETAETYIWLFRKWLRFMNYKLPDAIITDRCEAIRGAVAEVFPHVRHRFCLWQIMRKIPTKLGEMEEKEAISLILNKAVYGSLTITEFEREWGEMIKQYQLEDNLWLSSLFEDRKQWVPAYIKDTFWAGISAIERNERLKTFFDGCVTSETSLEMFLENYVSTLNSKIEEEAQEEFRSFHSKPQLVTGLPFEEQIAKVHTLNIFHVFQNEVKQSIQLNCYVVNRSGHTVTYIVTEFAGGRRIDYEVVYNNAGEEVWCVCRSFQFRGILCRHVLCVLRQEHLMLIPSKCILRRWRKDFKRLPVSISALQIGAMHEMSVYDTLYIHGYQYFANIVEIGAIGLNLKEFTLSVMKEAKDKIIRYQESHRGREVDENTEVSKHDRPSKARRGRPPKKRFAGERDTAVDNVNNGSNKDISTDPNRLNDMRSDYSDNIMLIQENQSNAAWLENPTWPQENFAYRQVEQNQSDATWLMTPNGTQLNFTSGVQEDQSSTPLPVMPDARQGGFRNRVGSIPVDNQTRYFQWPGFGNLDSSRRV